MIKEFLTECLEEAKKEYFETDHHYYNGDSGKDSYWQVNFDWDMFIEWVIPTINAKDKDVYEVCNLEGLFAYCEKLVKGEYNAE